MRLIDADALIARYDEEHKGTPGRARELITEAPTIDAEPVKHGAWVESQIPEEKYNCSICGGACWYYDYGGEVARSRYCPNCGAKMDGKTGGRKMTPFDERLDLLDIIAAAERDWDNYLDELYERDEDWEWSYEDFIADAILSAGYHKVKEEQHR